jgi:tRNA modification GTPase
MAEFHLHGSRAVLAAVLAALGRIPGLRLAEPGEFARRAFDRGKLDLSAIEGLADLIAAETEAQRRQALRLMAGALGARVESWRARLLRALAHVEAELDFSDQDLPGGLLAPLGPEIDGLAGEIAHHLADSRGERVREGLRVAILGAPNVGKSSLLNRLAGREAAIVSRHPGTTRDVVEVALDLEGYAVVLADTAGLRQAEAGAQGEIEAEGMRRARAVGAQADLRLVVIEAGAPAAPDVAAWIDARTLVVANKIDLAPAPARIADHAVWPVSALNGAGIDALVGEIARRARAAGADGAHAPLITRARHRQALAECHAALVRARGLATPELFAEELRLAARALGRITGRVGVEDVLDLVFAEFCIGK